LVEVVQTLRHLRCLFGFGQRRQQQPGQNRDDRDDNKKFDQGETSNGRSLGGRLPFRASENQVHKSFPLSVWFHVRFLKRGDFFKRPRTSGESSASAQPASTTGGLN
jgi:hypothetical protein